MARQYKAVVFDLDGTLLDTSEGIIASVRYTIDKFDLPHLGEEQLKLFIGPPIQDSFSRAFDLKGDVLQEIATVFRNQYKSIDLLKAKPYEGIYGVFENLIRNNIIPAIATYKRQDYAEIILKHFGFDKYTSIMCGADHNNVLKKKDIIEKALALANVDNYKEAVMVGDSDNDALGAKSLGLGFVAVTYGFGFKTADDANAFPNKGIASNVDMLNEFLV